MHCIPWSTEVPSKAERIARYIIDASSPLDLCGRIGAINDCDDGTFISLAAMSDVSMFAHLWDRVRHLPSTQRRLSDDAMYALCGFCNARLAELLLADGVDLAAFVHGVSGETAWHAAAECAIDLEFLEWIAVQSPGTINEKARDGMTSGKSLSSFFRVVLIQRFSMMRVILQLFWRGGMVTRL